MNATRHQSVEYTAEVAWIKYLDGQSRLPLEISFADVRDPKRVYILRMALTESMKWTRFSFRDLAVNKGLMRNADRLHSRFKVEPENMVMPTILVTMTEFDWQYTLRKFVLDHLVRYDEGKCGIDSVQIGVKSNNQKRFFKNECGLINIVNIKPSFKNTPILGCWHKHCRVVSFPCPATEARTMAMQLKIQRDGQRKDNSME
ncbi:unnamed protein product [Larinioides sclopetarius]|uniref:Uncharacterized protein n=1 Tax=Larinioides sclopetarius TaxID=280406 RepID=A0AAV2C1Y2_9ARAC